MNWNLKRDMHAKYISELRIAWATHFGRFENLFVNYLDLKNTKGQNMDKNKSMSNNQIYQNSVYMENACLIHQWNDNCNSNKVLLNWLINDLDLIKHL